MGNFIDSQGNYYEGDRVTMFDRSVPQRPSPDYKLVDGEWIIDQSEIDEKDNEEVKKTLADIDLKSIRSLREWLVTQVNAPQFIKVYEEDAKKERAKLK